ncbi:MAG: DNRLRE domain-containing protein [Planctomycetaceae bacterium]
MRASLPQCLCQAVVVGLVVVVGLADHGRAQTVALSGSTVGSTPSVLGFNSGHFTQGSNTGSWWKYAGVNGSRIFSTPSFLTPESAFRSGTGAAFDATSQAQFISQRDALRASGTASTYIKWSNVYTLYANSTTTGNNAIDLKYAQETMKSLGVKPLIVMTRSPASFSWPTSAADNTAAAWQDRWLGWQQWYAQAFISAQYADVENFQFFNEPDLYSNVSTPLSQEMLVEMTRVGASAVEAAIADVNRIFGKSLQAHVYGPVTSGPSLTAGDWGDTLLKNRSNQFITGSTAGYQLFDHFDYHNYGSSPASFGTRVQDTIADIDAITGGQAARFPIVISEFNTRTSANYAPNDPVNNPNGYTPDSVAMSSRLGQIVANLANNKPDELYLFKFSTAGGANNGVHWQSETGSENVGGATRSAMAYHLFAEGFTDNDLVAAPTSADAALTLAAAFDAAAGRRYVFAANSSATESKSLTIDLAPWNVAVGSTVTVRQVSGVHHGDISQTITVGATRTITVEQDPSGVVLVRAPTTSGLVRNPIVASDNAYVQEGSLTSNYSGAASLLVRSGTTLATHNATYLKFTLGTLDAAVLEDAALSINALDPGGSLPGEAGIVCHVYGITNTSWRQATSGTIAGITWATAPNVNQSRHDATRSTIDRNYVTGVGTTADIVGQFTATGTAAVLSIDVSRWVRERAAAGDTAVSFMITRDVRFDGDVDAAHSLSITSKEGAGANQSLAPTLTLTTRTGTIQLDVPSGSRTQSQTGNSVIRGTSPVVKLGSGTAVLDAANTSTGSTSVQAGTLRSAHASALANSPTVVTAGGTVQIAPGITLKAPRLVLEGGRLDAAGATILVGGSAGIRQLVINAGTVSGSPALVVAAGGTAALPDTAPLSVDLSALSIDQAAGAALDIGRGRLNIAAGGITESDLRAALLAGRNAGAWNGVGGIGSSEASAASSRAVGYRVFASGSAIVAWAAFGDVNLDGQVNSTDISLINAAGKFGKGPGSAAWWEGDFNYDGQVNSTDISLLNGSGIYGLGSYLPVAGMGGAVDDGGGWQVGGPTVGTLQHVATVPEPASLVLAAMAAASAWRPPRRLGRAVARWRRCPR